MHRSRLMLICFLFLMGSALTAAQDIVPLFEPVTQTRADAPLSADVLRARTVRLNPQVLEHAAVPGTQFALNLFDDMQLSAITVQAEARPEGQAGYVWYGSVGGVSEINAVMVVGNQLVTGSFYTPQGQFTLTLGADGLYRIEQSAQHINPSEPDFAVPPPPPAGRTAQPFDATRASSPYVDVMILFSPAARDILGGMEIARQRAEIMVATANIGRINSGVNHQMRLVHVDMVPYSERADMPADLNAITSSAKFNTLRNQYGADLVTLVTKDRTERYCGYGWILMSMQDISWSQRYGYNIVNHDCTLDIVFAHESGHNMGGLHDHANSGGGTGLTPYAYGYQDPQGEFATIMAYKTGGSCENSYCNSAVMFSTPNRWFMGRRAGRANWADMTRLLNETGAFVANFRPSKGTAPPLPAFNLIEPADGFVVTGLNTEFRWQESPGATDYRLAVTDPAGKVIYQRVITADACNAGICMFDTSSVSNWNPPAFATLSWRIRASNNVYQNVRFSAYHTLQMALLPKPVTLNTPLAEESVTTFQPVFTWSHDARVDSYRMLLFGPDNKKILTQPWALAQDICVLDTCSTTLDLRQLSVAVKEGGRYTWRIQATRSGITQVTLSERRPFTVDVLPESIAVLTPEVNEAVTTRQPVFTWTRAQNVARYRFVYTNASKVTLNSPWIDAETLCTGDSCSLDLTSQSFMLPFMAGRWTIEGRTPRVIGVTSSVSRRIRVLKP